MNKKNSGYNFDFTEVILFLVNNWKKLVIISLAAGIVGGIATLPVFITPMFKSVCVFYPGMNNSISNALFYTNKQKAADPLMYAEQEVTEHYMQLLQSGDLIGRVLGKFELYKHYNLDPANVNDQKKMAKIYEQNIEFNRTDFNSIKVSVLDPDPEMAAKLANGIVELMDQLKTEVQRRTAKQIFHIVEKEYLGKLHYCDSIKARLKELGADGVYDLTNQSKGLSEALGNGHTGAAFEKEKARLAEHGGEAFLLITMLEFEAENLTLLRTKYEQAKVDMEAELSNVFVISKAEVPSYKAFPRRTIIVISSMIAGFVMGCMLIIGAAKVNEFRQKLQS